MGYSFRKNRLEELFRRQLSVLLTQRKFVSSRFPKGLDLTITDVQLSDNYSYLKIFFLSFLSIEDEKQVKMIEDQFFEFIYFEKNKLFRKLQIPKIPKITVAYDTQYDITSAD